MTNRTPRRRITRNPIAKTPAERVAFAALRILQSQDIQGGEHFTPAHGDVGIRFAGVRGYFVWTESKGWGMCDVWGCDLTKHLGGMIPSVDIIRSL